MAGCLPKPEPQLLAAEAKEVDPLETSSEVPRLRLVANNPSPREPDDRPDSQSRNHKVSDKVSK